MFSRGRIILMFSIFKVKTLKLGEAGFTLDWGDAGGGMVIRGDQITCVVTV